MQALNDAIRAARQERGELAGELAYKTAEGERSFAPGDRLLFRENHRDLNVKNGMLATVERAEEGRLEVRLDSAHGPGKGRVVSVSLADYAAVDHGYVTTIHKSQGATVDCCWVLASGTMDRHLTYVAMTRHRDAVRLYAGTDEFTNAGALATRLSRSQAKETTLDYERAGYAARRGIESEIVVPGLLHEAMGVERLAKKRGLFGLKLGAGRPEEGRSRPEAGRGAFEAQQQAPDGLSRAVERYARAWADAARMRAQDLPILEHQIAALREAGAALDAARPGAMRDLMAALQHEPETARAMAKLQGHERVAQLVAGIEHEERVRRDPHLKAERLVKVWNRLEAQHERLSGREQAEARGQVEARMKTIASELKRDPQLESLLRSRSRELGIEAGSRLERVMRERDIERAIGRGVERGGPDRSR